MDIKSYEPTRRSIVYAKFGEVQFAHPLLRANRKAAARRSARKVGLPAFRGQVDYTASCRVIAGEMRICRAALFLSEFASEFASAHHMKPALAVKQTVGNQRVQVRMEVEIFAEGVDRHHDTTTCNHSSLNIIRTDNQPLISISFSAVAKAEYIPSNASKR